MSGHEAESPRLRAGVLPVRFGLNTPSASVIFLIALVVGAIYALSILGVSFIFGHNAYWTEPFGDQIQHRVGAMYFARDDWRFPLFLVSKLNFPEGANIVLTDSLPLLAVAFKVIYKLTGHWFNYFGFWLFTCFPLLAAFTALAAKEAGVDDLTGLLGASLLALASPGFLMRFGHAALMGQFLIAWSIFLYFRLRHQPDSRSALIQFCVVLALAILVHPYFLAMVFPFFIAALAQSVIEGRTSKARGAIDFGLGAGAVVLMAWISGIVTSRGFPSPIWGYGFYSMNALSPFLPPRQHLPEFLARLVAWDRRGQTWDATHGQYEGYNYLGVGMLLLCVVHLVTSRSLMKSALRRHVVLVLMLAGLATYALSNRIYVGSWLVLDLPLPPPLAELTGQFRVGGRYFWPVYYALVVGLVALTWRRFGATVARVVIVAAVLLQLADTQFLRDAMTNRTSRGWTQQLPADQWRPLVAAHRFLKQYPSYQCDGWGDAPAPGEANLELLLLTAQLDTPTNSVPVDRGKFNCADEVAEGVKFDIQPDGLYTYGGSFPINGIKAMPSFKDWCREFQYGVVCTRNWDRIPQLAALSAFAPITHWLIPEYRLGEELTFAEGGNGLPYLAAGWSEPEEWGIWSTGNRSEIVMRLPRLDTDVRLKVDAYAFVHQARPHKEVTVFINDMPMATWSFNQGEGTQTRSIELSKALFQQAQALTIRFFSPAVESPEQVGLWQDERKISVALVDLTLEPVTSAENFHPLPNR